MKEYNVVWNSQSITSADSMPFGGYDIGCNAWVEDNQIRIYISQSGTFDENGTMLKHGRLRFWLEDSTLLSTNFRQEFHLEDGYVSIDAGEEGNRVHFTLWAATNKSEVHVEYEADQPHTVHMAFDNWRYKEREVGAEVECHQCRDYTFGYPGGVTTYPDTVEAGEHQLIFYHRNRRDQLVWDKLIKQQYLEPIQDKIPNPFLNRTMGGCIAAEGMKFVGVRNGVYLHTDHEEYEYQFEEGRQVHVVTTLHTNQCESVDAWKKELQLKMLVPVCHKEAVEWWNDYAKTSYIQINKTKKDSEYYNIGRNYQLFRYMLGCNYYGEYPTKFNGGLFTFDDQFTPDYRMWSGAGFTSQNQRLVYWPMLKSGDFECMKPQMDFFKNLNEAGKARVRYFWNHNGACFYEQGNAMGVCTGAEYGWHRDARVDKGEDDNPWVRLHYSSALEFALMMLEYARYSGEKIDPYMEYIDSVVTFYFEHYGRDENGKLYLFPSTALETYKGENPKSKDDTEYGCTNPMDAVAGIRSVLEGLIDYTKEEALKEKYRKMLAISPELPIGMKHGKEEFLPAKTYTGIFNCELPQLYRIFPYSQFGLSKREVELGKNTYLETYDNPDQYIGYSWHQNGIFAARLGLVEEAEKYLRIKLEDAPKRFPAFWGPGHDWTPDHNHGGSGMIGLQEMLMQCEKQTIRLFPSWDKSIDVSFKLHAPQNTVVECTLKDGMIQHLTVVPKDRMEDLIIC